MCACMPHGCRCSPEARGGTGCPGARVTGDREPGAGNQTWVLWQNRRPLNCSPTSSAPQQGVKLHVRFVLGPINYVEIVFPHSHPSTEDWIWGLVELSKYSTSQLHAQLSQGPLTDSFFTPLNKTEVQVTPVSFPSTAQFPFRNPFYPEGADWHLLGPEGVMWLRLIQPGQAILATLC